jgi:hypothetical protein
MEQNKCFVCETKKIHTFSECLSIKCQCTCVTQIYKMRVNRRKEDIKPVHPKFLKIENGKIKDLPGVAEEITRFVRIDRKEWLPKRKDKRFKGK